MRVAHVNLSKEFRGGECQTLALVEAIEESEFSSNIDQVVVARRNSRMEQACTSIEGIELRSVKPTIAAAACALANVDLVHIHEGRSTPVGALKSLSGTPFIITRRVPRRPKNFSPTRWCYRRAAEIACVSQDVANVMSEYLPDTNIAVVADCVRKLPRSKASTPTVIPGNLVVGTIGELDIASKGQDRIINAARALQGSHPDIQFWIIGEGRDERYLKELAEGLENIRFTGWVPNVGDYLACIDILAHPARSEGLGSVMLEAMASSVPVVGSEVGGIPEIVSHEYNGLLFDANSPDGLTQALDKIASDQDFRQRMADNAKATAARFSPQIMAQRYYEMYLHVMGIQGGA